MSNTKKRILLIGDSHFLSSGYSTYILNVLKGLNNTGRYELAELGCYGTIKDTRLDLSVCKWKYYANAVEPDHPLYNKYKSHPQNEHGKWRFERVLLDFKPDIVFVFSDPYVYSHACLSPLRPFYHLCAMPTVDSAPQKDDFLDIIYDADSLFTYSKYGENILKSYNSKIPIIGQAPPVADINIFKPISNKKELKRLVGLFEDSYIVGTVMRNQPRKLFPDLFEAFRNFLDKCYSENKKELWQKTFLYCHTSYPDIKGWEIPNLLKTYGIGHKVLFTYKCKICNQVFCSFFNDAKRVCPSCNNVSALLPNTSDGVSQYELAQIMNVFDVYVQYSCAEGFGVTLPEVASCGIQTMVVDYSALEDFKNTINSIPIKVGRMFNDIGTGAKRALPDNEDFINKLINYLERPESLRIRDSYKIRKSVEKNYTWDIIVERLDRHFSNLELKGLQGKWDAPARKISTKAKINTNLNNEDFIDTCISNLMQEERLRNSAYSMKNTRNLNYGCKIGENALFTKTRFLDLCNQYLENKIECERARIGQLPLDRLDFIEFASNIEELVAFASKKEVNTNE